LGVGCRSCGWGTEVGGGVQATVSRVSGSSKSSIINRVGLVGFRSSTKIEAVREELQRMLHRDPSGKAIVFSQFTSMLDLIAFRLQQVASLPLIVSKFNGNGMMQISALDGSCGDQLDSSTIDCYRRKRLYGGAVVRGVIHPMQVRFVGTLRQLGTSK
jgi:hypothetical protein